MSTCYKLHILLDKLFVQQSLTTEVKYVSHRNILLEKSPISQFLFKVGFS